MPQLPYAPTETCPSCGADARRNRYQFSLAETAAWDTIHSGNLCEGCYEDVVAVIESESRDPPR